MDLIMMDENNQDIGIVYPTGDIEYGTDDARNDFELTCEYFKNGYAIYVEGSECGGAILKAKETSGQKGKYYGDTWRGLMKKDIINPPSGSDYRTVEGEANSVLKALIAESEMLSAWFEVSEETSAITITSYQFALYTDYLTGIISMCEENDAKLVIKATKKDTDKKVHIILSIEPAVTEEGQYDVDSGLVLTFTDDQSGITHLQCMGSGELQNRMRVDLYLHPDGSINEEKYYYGRKNRTALYDEGNAESRESLVKNGTKRLKELATGKSLGIEEDYNTHLVGDKVKGIKPDDGLTVESAIKAAIVRFDGGEPTIEYSEKEVG